MSNPTRKTKDQDLEAITQARLRHAQLPVDDQMQEKLDQLQTFIRQMESSMAGRTELQRRTRRFGECRMLEGESVREFHGRLRCWLDRDLTDEKAANF